MFGWSAVTVVWIACVCVALGVCFTVARCGLDIVSWSLEFCVLFWLLAGVVLY